MSVREIMTIAVASNVVGDAGSSTSCTNREIGLKPFSGGRNQAIADAGRRPESNDRCGMVLLPCLTHSSITLMHSFARECDDLEFLQS